MKERIVYIDRLKGFGIFLVVLGHLIQNNVINGTSHTLFNVIYSFHMPFFFFLSGYVAYKTSKIDSFKSIPLYIKNKAIALLIPMLSWPLIHKYFFTNANDYSLDSIGNILLSEIANPGLWFLKMLFEIFVIYSVFHIISNSLNSRKTITIDLLLITSSYLLFGFVLYLTEDHGIITFILNYSFFMVGVFLSKFNLVLKIIENKYIASFGTLIFMLIVGHYVFLQSDLLLMKALKIIISLTAIVSFYTVFKKIGLPIWLDSYLSKLGQKSLLIYVTHFSFFSLLSSNILLAKEISTPLLLLIIIPISIILMSFCIAIGNVIAVFPFLNFLFYGVPIKKASICS